MSKVLNKNCFVQKFEVKILRAKKLGTALASHCKDPSSCFTPLRPKRSFLYLCGFWGDTSYG